MSKISSLSSRFSGPNFHLTLFAATFLSGYCLSQSLAQTDPIPIIPDWTAPDQDNAPVTLADDLAEPVPPSIDEASPVEEPIFDEPIAPSLPMDPFPSADRMPSEELVIGPAPEELEPSFIPPAPPDAPRSPVPSETAEDVFFGVPTEGGNYLPDLTDPLDPFFQIDGLKIRIGELHIRLPVGRLIPVQRQYFPE